MFNILPIACLVYSVRRSSEFWQFGGGKKTL